MWKSVETFCLRSSSWRPTENSHRRPRRMSRSWSRACWYFPLIASHRIASLLSFMSFVSLRDPLYLFFFFWQEGKLEPEEFTSRLYRELSSSPQPYLVPFLKVSSPTNPAIPSCVNVWAYYTFNQRFIRNYLSTVHSLQQTSYSNDFKLLSSGSY